MEFRRKGTSDLNVIVFGETQAGKSTFIKFLYEYGGSMNPPAHLRTGDGNGSCTKSCHLYHLAFHKMDCPTFDESQMTEMDWLKDKSYVANVTPNHRFYYSLNIIDTPGLKDSQGRDDEILVNVAKALSDFEQLHAVIFVVNKAKAFTKTFQECVHLYRQIIPGFASRFIIVHSNWSPITANQKLSDYYNSTKEREKAYQNLFSLQASHFFMDNVIPKDGRIRRLEFRKAYAYNGLTNLLDHLKTYEPVSLATLA